ncbi:MAG: 30S ribosomal protein S8 [Candidatus Vogelbacteria bacterium]|nr:30S ribosomal protein S8 [Candidatus Vogelbacteria bacterium]
MVTDPIADFITRLRNGSSVGQSTVAVDFSNLTMAIAEKLAAVGLLKAVVKKGKKTRKIIEVELAYQKGRPLITNAKRLSKSSRRVYLGWRAIRPIRQGYGQLIISTARGVLTGDESRRLKVGGEPLFTIW